MTSQAPEDTRTLIDELLAEQRTLTAVERFARKHENHELPAQERYYRELIPLEKPRPGEQYAFAVDMDACSGCKACVSACHSLNGLDEEEMWRSTGLLHGGTTAQPYQQIVTTACHHCVDPACLNGCPVLAYDKDPVTGIVRHLDDQCIGCQYCVLKCPYDVPKYSAKRGIVRKCDMCYNRLAANEAPACVQACPSAAITIRVVSTANYARNGKPITGSILPGAFESDYTRPTTTYTSRKPIPANARPADNHALRLEHAHWPLVWMLVLSQASAGIVFASFLASVASPEAFTIVKSGLAISSFVILQIGLAASVCHLGRPFGAWRAFLGLRRSWMSREIVVFGAFAGAVTALVGATFIEKFTALCPTLAGASALAGMLGIFCSAMIYVDTKRPFWSPSQTFTKFFGTTLLLGTAGFAGVSQWLSLSTTLVHVVIWVAIVTSVATLVTESVSLLTGLKNVNSPIHRSTLVMWTLLKPLVIARMVLLAVTGICGLMAVASGHAAVWSVTAMFVAALGSQIMERYLFFVAVAAPRMPGGVPS